MCINEIARRPHKKYAQSIMPVALYTQVIFWISLAGVLFTGYLSAHQLIMKECAFNEPCPYFFGFPACWVGFCLFFIMFATAVAVRANLLSISIVKDTIFWASLFGIFFAGYYTIQELVAWMQSGMKRYALVLPTCAYGLVFYAALFALSLVR